MKSDASGIDRRAFLRSLGGAAVGSLVGCARKRQTFPPVQGATSAERAVHAAQRFAGTSLNVGWESGPQAEALGRFAAPLWQQLTGMRINIVEMGWPLDQFRRIVAEHRAGTSALDCAAVAPTWLPDLLADHTLEPLDDYAAHYLISSDIDDYLPLYRTLGVSQGRRYGFFDDGDALVLYYRRDLFDDPSQQKDFAARYGRDLGDPRQYNWRQFTEAARYFTEKYAPDLYGLAPLSREVFWACFQYRLRVEGGQFFDKESMRPGIDTPAGQRALTQVVEMIRMMVPLGMIEPVLSTSFASFLSGRAAMAISWPPLGRLAEMGTGGTGTLGFLPKSLVVGKTDYALLPDGLSQMAVGFTLSVLAHSRKKEAAYLFIQWLSSPEVSLERVMRLTTLRDPYRFSHVQDPGFRVLWPRAGEYLDVLKKAGTDAALTELAIPGAGEYQESFYEALTNIRLGKPVPAALEHLAQSWDQTTTKNGRERVRRGYADFLAQPGALLPRWVSKAADGAPR